MCRSKNRMFASTRVELLDEAPVFGACTAKILPPGFQAEWKYMRKQRILDLGIEQVLRVLPEIANFRAIAGS